MDSTKGKISGSNERIRASPVIQAKEVSSNEDEAQERSIYFTAPETAPDHPAISGPEVNRNQRTSTTLNMDRTGSRKRKAEDITLDRQSEIDRLADGSLMLWQLEVIHSLFFLLHMTLSAKIVEPL